jgi:nucleoside-diphosphate kinase
MTRILNEGFKITNMAIISPSLDTMEMHYQEHKGKEFFNDVCARMANKPLIVMKVEGVDVIHKMRQLCGKTDCSEKGTIRGDFGTGVKENVIHASSGDFSICSV